MSTSITRNTEEQTTTMQQYYRWQSRIYDATRWAFLFGRNEILRLLPFSPSDSFHLLEVGCGTGFNLKRLARRYPQARFTGMDVSEDMVRLSKKATDGLHGVKVEVWHQPYLPEPSKLSGQLDAVLYSYALTMINPQWSDLIEQAKKDLKPGGIIAVVDFHDSPLPFFKTHMSHHHVRMDGHLLPKLKALFSPIQSEVRKAYIGSWEYLVFLGRKEN